METPFVKYAAKAVAAAAVGPVLAGLAWVSAEVFPFDYDPDVVETGLTAGATAVIVFFVRNQARLKSAREALQDYLAALREADRTELDG